MATLEIPLRPAGVALGTSGLTWAMATPFHPSIFTDDVARVVRDTNGWVPMHLAILVGAVLAILGAGGLAAAHGDDLGPHRGAVLMLTITGAVIVAAAMAAEAVVFPILAERAPELLDLDGPLLGSWLLRATVIAGGAYPIGLALLGILVARARLDPRGGRFLAWSVVGFVALGGPFVPVLGTVATAAFAAAHVRLGWTLWRAQPTSAPQRLEVAEAVRSS